VSGSPAYNGPPPSWRELAVVLITIAAVAVTGWGVSHLLTYLGYLRLAW
jgi:hypothetical protein